VSILPGHGFVKAVNTICNEIYVEMRKISSHLNTRRDAARESGVAKALKRTTRVC